MSAPGKLLVLGMLTPDPKCLRRNQSGCGFSYLGLAMSIWTVCEDQQCLSVLGC